MAIKPFQQFGYVDTYSDLASLKGVEGQLVMTLDSKASFIMTGGVWLPFGRLVVKKSSVVVDGKTTGATAIYTLEPSPLNFYPTQAIIRAVSVSGATIKPTLSAGTNPTAYDNIMSGSLLNTVTSTVGITSAPLSVSTSPPLAAGTIIMANVSIAAVATSYTFKIDIIGYYET